MDEEVEVLALCEVDHLFLRPGVLYRFEIIEGCSTCEALNVYKNEGEDHDEDSGTR